MNNKRKLVWEILIPIITFFIALIIATKYYHSPFDLKKTWFIWLTYLLYCWSFEYSINMEDPEEIDTSLLPEKMKISLLPRYMLMWGYETFIYSLAPMFFFVGILILGNIFISVGNKFMDFPWSIKLPVFTAMGICLRIWRNNYLKRYRNYTKVNLRVNNTTGQFEIWLGRDNRWQPYHIENLKIHYQNIEGE